MVEFFFSFFAKNADPDQMPQNAASDLGLHCWQNTLLGFSRLQWVRVVRFSDGMQKQF